jgi:hypothetical protein
MASVCRKVNLDCHSRAWHLSAVRKCPDSAAAIPLRFVAPPSSGSSPGGRGSRRNRVTPPCLPSPLASDVPPTMSRPLSRCCTLAGCTCHTPDTSVMRVDYTLSTKPEFVRYLPYITYPKSKMALKLCRTAYVTLSIGVQLSLCLIFFIIPLHLQSVPVHPTNCIKPYTVACRRVLGSAPL